jgi:hypothetical protein
VKLVLAKAGNGNLESKNRYSWIPRINCGAGSAGVYPDENRGRNDKPQRQQPESQKFENVPKIPEKQRFPPTMRLIRTAMKYGQL